MAFCRIVQALIFLILIVAICTYSIVADYRLKQMACYNNTSPTDTFLNQILHKYTFGLYGFLAGKKYQNAKFQVKD